MSGQYVVVILRFVTVGYIALMYVSELCQGADQSAALGSWPPQLQDLSKVFTHRNSANGF